jgi:hypothetical protein
MIKNLAPIALFVFNRPWHTRQTVEALQLNELAHQSDLFVFSDGPKTEADQKKVQEVRTYIRKLRGFKSISLLERETNRGLAQSIISGVTDLINDHGRVIVLEDDLVTSRYFITFMNQALDKYEKEPRVMHISGYMYPIREFEKLPASFFYRETHSWGWGTWKRAWDHFEPNPQHLLLLLTKQGLIEEFDISGAKRFSTMLKHQISGYTDSWMIRWYASAFLNRGLCLYPSKSLVSNIGNDGSGTHTGRITDYDVIVSNSPVGGFPDAVEESNAALSAIIQFHRSMRNPLLKRTVWLLRKISKKVIGEMRALIRQEKSNNA